MIKNNISILLIILCLFHISCSDNPKTLDELLTGYANNGKRKIKSPFSGVVLVAKNGNIEFKEAYGLKNRESDTPNTTETKFPIASITKQFTALLVMQMVEDGKIKLSDSLSQYLSYLPKSFSNQMTIHQLLSHTAGLPHYEGLFSSGINEEVFRKGVYTPKALATMISNTELIYQPGSKFHYSSLGYMLLGAVLEEVSSKSYAALLKENITEPLGMSQTGFASNEYIRNETATGYQFKEDETYKMIFMEYGGEIKSVKFRDQSNKYATGGMHSTVDDLFKWSEAIRKSKLLKRETTEKMLKPNIDGYCYGWFRNWDELIERNTKVKMYMHGGALSGYRSSISLYDDGTTIIYLANIAPIKDTELTHQIYLSAHGLKDQYRMTGYPDRGSLSEFESEGGIKAFNAYFNQLSALCGYQVLPSSSSVGQLTELHYEAGKQARADSLKQFFLTAYNPSENMVNRLGYNLIESNCEVAVDFFKENAKRHPDSPNVWDSLGEGLLACGQTKEAVASHAKAVAIAEKTGNSLLDRYEENLVKARGMLSNN